MSNNCNVDYVDNCAETYTEQSADVKAAECGDMKKACVSVADATRRRIMHRVTTPSIKAHAGGAPLGNVAI